MFYRIKKSYDDKDKDLDSGVLRISIQFNNCQITLCSRIAVWVGSGFIKKSIEVVLVEIVI